MPSYAAGTVESRRAVETPSVGPGIPENRWNEGVGPAAADLQKSVARSAWAAMEWPESPLRVADQPKREKLVLRMFILLAAAGLAGFVVWILQPVRMGDPLAYWALTGALLLRGVLWVFEWWNYWGVTVPPVVRAKRRWTVDVLTTACPGEPQEMIVRTLRAMVAMRGSPMCYLCDEGDDPYLKSVCEELGVVHVTRREKKGAKAGNINNALGRCQGELVVVLDPDHEPSPYMLERTVGYFEDEAVGFVQSVQGYRNQSDSFVARGAAEQSYHFYGPIMLGMHGHQTTQVIGANCVFRRMALDNIGGHATGLAEDMHTGMRLYSKGWKSVYVPEILTRGLVPNSLQAFFKQQIKWSCGAFDLLFQEYPKLFGGFTWKQRLHYLIAPLYFLRGLITLLEMAVPLLCLALGLVAWKAPLVQIAGGLVPVVLLATLVRMRAQRWLLEPSEYGTHLCGGILSGATWWAYNLGVLCAVFRVKVPYIPTPKEDRPSNAGWIVLPNVLTAGVLTAAAAYGIYLDSSPTSLVMCGLAGVNVVALLYVSVVTQQATLLGWRRRMAFLRQVRDGLVLPCVMAWRWLHDLSLGLARERLGPVLLVLAIAVAGYGGYAMEEGRTQVNDLTVPVVEKSVGGFYVGLDSGKADFGEIERSLSHQFTLVVTTASLATVAVAEQADDLEPLREIRKAGGVPLVRLNSGRSVDFAAIGAGASDRRLAELADAYRRYGDAVLVSFAEGPDETGADSATFVAAWRHIISVFQAEGATNVGWVLTVARGENVERYYPGDGYVDWVAVESRSDRGKPRRWREEFADYRATLAAHHLPVMLMLDAEKEANLPETLADAGRAVEVKAVVIGGIRDEKEVAAVRQALSGWPRGRMRPVNDSPPWEEVAPLPLTRRHGTVAGEPGQFQLLVGGKPFYVRGISYNPGHDWRDPDCPLSRRELAADFSAIHDMGANTIRRYGSCWSDRNIFNVAGEHDLKVMYGFYFEPTVDYGSDSAAEAEYERQVLEKVKMYRNHPGLLGWSLGNEVWGLLKKKYGQPYLTEVRHNYVRFVERLAKEVKELDPDHPVFCAQECTREIGGTFADFARGAPDVDVIGVNCFYESDIAGLDPFARRFDPGRPYLVSEFGPDGYWDETRNHVDSGGGLLEATAAAKAGQYAERWRHYVLPNKGANIGGIAYCWRDRYEGTATWFGITDLEGRKKPAYSALQRMWNAAAVDWTGELAVRIVSVNGISEGASPRGKVNLKAEVEAASGVGLAFEWSVVGPSYAPNAGHVVSVGAGDEAIITMPDEPGWYRVNVKVLAGGNMDEASVPVRVLEAVSPATRQAGR